MDGRTMHVCGQACMCVQKVREWMRDGGEGGPNYLALR